MRKEKKSYTYPSNSDLPKCLPYSSHFLCCQLQEQMKCMKIWISLFLSFFLGTHIWVFVLATHYFFNSHLLTHSMPHFCLGRPFEFSTWLGFSLFKQFFLFPFFNEKQYTNSTIMKLKLQCICQLNQYKECAIENMNKQEIGSPMLTFHGK